MGLFSKKENDKEKAPAPPGPPKPNQGNSTGSPLPPPPGGKQAPPSPPSPENKEETQSNNQSSQYGSMPQPPTPMGGLDEIKNQISTPSNTTSTPSTPAAPQQHEEGSNDDLESLFDFSDLDEQIQGSQETATHTNELPQEQSSQEGLPQQREHSEEELTFLKTRDKPHSSQHNESIYITTSQFKALLEIVEEVKLKAKDSSERHLRLLDIKSEEDIEFENLKKDFAFIEDKLYEVDNLIFER